MPPCNWALCFRLPGVPAFSYRLVITVTNPPIFLKYRFHAEMHHLAGPLSGNFRPDSLGSRGSLSLYYRKAARINRWPEIHHELLPRSPFAWLSAWPSLLDLRRRRWPRALTARLWRQAQFFPPTIPGTSIFPHFPSIPILPPSSHRSEQGHPCIPISAPSTRANPWVFPMLRWDRAKPNWR